MIRITPKDSYYRIQEPVSGLCVRLHCTATTADAAPAIVPKLAPGPLATWFRSHAEAAEAFARYLGVAPFDIVRVDA